MLQPILCKWFKGLQTDYDLTVPALKGLCNSTIDDTCCSCMKKKTCSDTGCSSHFGGQGNNWYVLILEVSFLLKSG